RVATYVAPTKTRCRKERPRRRGRASLFQCLETQPVWTGVVVEAALLVFLVLAVVAREELHVAVALEREDVGRDAVQEPAVMADHEHVAGELQQRVLECTQGLDVEVVGR